VSLHRTRWGSQRPLRQPLRCAPISGLWSFLRGSHDVGTFGSLTKHRRYTSLPRRMSPGPLSTRSGSRCRTDAQASSGRTAEHLQRLTRATRQLGTRASGGFGPCDPRSHGDREEPVRPVSTLTKRQLAGGSTGSRSLGYSRAGDREASHLSRPRRGADGLIFAPS